MVPSLTQSPREDAYGLAIVARSDQNCSEEAARPQREDWNVPGLGLSARSPAHAVTRNTFEQEFFE
jgi:hypothetical protein